MKARFISLLITSLMLFTIFPIIAQNTIIQLIASESHQSKNEKIELFLEVQPHQSKADKGFQIELLLKNTSEQNLVIDNPLHELNFILMDNHKRRNIALFNTGMYYKMMRQPNDSILLMNKNFELKKTTLNLKTLPNFKITDKNIFLASKSQLRLSLSISEVDSRSEVGDLKPNYGTQKTEPFAVGEYEFAVNCPIRIRSPKVEHLSFFMELIPIEYGL